MFICGGDRSPIENVDAATRSLGTEMTENWATSPRFRYLLFLLFSVAMVIVGSVAVTKDTYQPGEDIVSGLLLELPKQRPDSESVEFFINSSIFQFQVSPEQKFAIFSTVELGASPELFLFSASDERVRRVTDSTDIEYDPVVNDRGDYAFAVHSGSVGQSTVRLNGLSLDLPPGLYKVLTITDDHLAGHGFSAYEDYNYVFLHNIAHEATIYIPVDAYVDGLYFRDDDFLIITGIAEDSYDRLWFGYDMVTSTLAPIEARAEPICEPLIADVSLAGPHCSGSNSVDGELLERGLRHLWTYDPALSLSCSNNHLGRLSWYVAYRLRALVELHRANRSQNAFPTRRVAEHAADCLLRQAGNGEGGSLIGWPTTKYSTDGSHLDLLIDNATILVGLLLLANEGLLSEASAARVVSLGERMYAYYETHFDGEIGGYRFRRGIAFHYDGAILPFNMQNEFGAALIQLYVATGRDIYRLRALQLATKFRKSWRTSEAGTVLWHYWPDSFYRGWTENDLVSTNTPSLEPSDDVLYEDISHAGHNVQFALDTFQHLPDGPITAEDISALTRTIATFRIGNLYSRFMSGDTEYQPASVRFVPKFGWTAVADETLAMHLTSGIASDSIFFDGDNALSYLSALNATSRIP